MTLSFAQLKTLLHDITVTITGLNGSMVRHDYPQDDQPVGHITEDVIYITLTPIISEENDYSNFRDIQYIKQDNQTAVENVFYTRVMQGSWTLHGPNSFDNADLLRHGLLLENNRAVLSANGVYPLSQIAQPIRHPYPYNDQWWESSVLNVTFNVATLRINTVPFLQAANIEIVTEDGVQRTIHVTESD